MKEQSLYSPTWIAAHFAPPPSAAEEPSAEPERTSPPSAAKADRLWVFGSAAVIGFAFFLMALVWYRMLAPLLGGTIFDLSLILGSALLGIGLGSALYAMLWSDRRGSLAGLALGCSVAALVVAAPT